MNAVNVKRGKKYSVKVVNSYEHRSYISARDVEMDERATEAVKSAVEKAKFCKKPVAKYDMVTKKAYVEYADGVKKYVN